MALDVAALRQQFPMLQRRVGGKPIHYLDSANTSQKPVCVIDAMSRFMREGYGPIGRSSYTLASEASDAYEEARAKVARFINARSPREVVFTKNATESLNLAAQSWGRANLGKGDAVVLTHMEHHANIVPWQMLAAEKGFELRWVPLTSDGLLDLSDLDRLLDRGLGHVDLLEAPAQRRVFLEDAPVLGEGGRANALHRARAERQNLQTTPSSQLIPR